MYEGGDISRETAFPLMQQVSALMGNLGDTFNLNLWVVMWKPGNDSWIGFFGGTRWCLKDDWGQPIYLMYNMAEGYDIYETSVKPYTYFSISLIQIGCPGVGRDYKPYNWSSVNNDSIIEVIDIFGNHGSVTVGYKDDTSVPDFPKSH